MTRQSWHQVASQQVGIDVLRRLADTGWVVAAHWLAWLVYRFDWTLYHTIATFAAAVLFYLAGEFGHLHGPSWRTPTLANEVRKVWGVWLPVMAGLTLLAFLTKTSEEFSRVATAIWFAAAPTIVSLFRVSVRLVLRRVRAQGRNTRTVALVGATEVGAALARRIKSRPELGLRVVGFYDDREPERRELLPDDVPQVVGGLSAAVTAARRGEVDVVYVTLPLRAQARINELVRAFADTTASVYVVADFFVFDLLHAKWSDVDGLPVVSIFDTPFYGAAGWLKRLEDVVLSSLILALIAIPMAVIAIGVKLSSAGPVFFRQRRYGLNGQEIKVLKFRTMTVAEDGAKVVQARKGDSRITPFGAFLRKTSLDELPQFLNVLTGAMSIVGPRPHAVAHNEEYRRLVHGYMLRHKVKPGITGWAQVNGFRGETDTLEKMERRVEHDLEYIQRWSLLLDLRIILRTVSVVLAAKNAY